MAALIPPMYVLYIIVVYVKVACRLSESVPGIIRDKVKK